MVVDDDKRIRQLLSQYLKNNGYFVSSAPCADEARIVQENIKCDLIILDVMMPGENGISFVSSLRKTSDIPIIMLTAMDDVHNRITGLETGADDYLGKPFEPKELLLRIKKILNRLRTNNKNIASFGQLNFDFHTKILTKNDIIIPLTTMEESLLMLLIQYGNNVLSREMASKHLGGINHRSIDVQITRLRNKIEENPKNPRFLRTIRGNGYLLLQN